MNENDNPQSPVKEGMKRNLPALILLWAIPAVVVFFILFFSVVLYFMLSPSGAYPPTTADNLFCNGVLLLTGFTGKTTALLTVIIAICAALAWRGWKGLPAALPTISLILILFCVASVALSLGGAGNTCMAD